MVDILLPGHVAIGGKQHYIEVISQSAAFVKLINVLDNLHNNNQEFITGVAFNPKTKDLFSVSTPNLTQPLAPHDICWMPDNTGFLVAVVPSPGSLELREYDYDGHLLHTWDGLDTDPGWTNQSVKIDVACDGKTVYYTDSLMTIFKYNLTTSTQLPFYEQLPGGSTSRYCGIALLPHRRNQSTSGGLEIGPQAIVAITDPEGGATGPSRAVCIGADHSIWTDEINPTGSYEILKKKLSDGTNILTVTTEASPTPTNDKTLALACSFLKCASGIGCVFIQHCGS